MAEENVEVDDDINEIEAVIGIPKAPNKDTNTNHPLWVLTDLFWVGNSVWVVLP